jgi:hypothetical protein
MGIGSAVRAGHRDSIEALVQDWSGSKPPTREELQLHQHDLLQTARVIRAMAELAPHRRSIYVPANNERMGEKWQQVCGEFKTVTRDLQLAVADINEARTRQAAIKLQKTCNACHQIVGR